MKTALFIDWADAISGELRQIRKLLTITNESTSIYYNGSDLTKEQVKDISNKLDEEMGISYPDDTPNMFTGGMIPKLRPANDPSILKYGKPIPVPFRILSEHNYQELILKRTEAIKAMNAEAKRRIRETFYKDSVPDFTSRTVLSSHILDVIDEVIK